MVGRTGRCFVLILILALSAAACDGSRLSQPKAPTAPEESQLPHRVAILPFVNKTSNPQAGSIVQKMFYNFFSSLNYLDVEPSRVDSILKQKGLHKRIISGERISPQRLGRILGVDAVIYGEVFSFGQFYAVVYSETRAGLRAQMVMCESGDTVWQHKHVEKLRKGDAPSSLTGLAKTLVTSVINFEKASTMKAASALCSEMVSTMPNPSAIAEPPPHIKVLVHNGAGKLLRPGERLKVVMIGDPGQGASWEISPLVKNLAMEEKEPGVYVGAYRVTAQDRLSYGRLVGHLRSSREMESHWVDVLGPVRLGEPTPLPSQISIDTILSPEGGPYLVEQVLLVQPGVKFILEPGTVVWFRQFGMVVRGEILAQGTPENPVRFSGLGSSNWKGIFLEGSRGNNVLSHCVVSDAEYGLRTFDSKVTVNGCLFQSNVWAIVVDGGAAQVEHSHVRTSDEAGLSARKARIVVRDCMISENKSGGVLLRGSQAQIEHNNIVNNGRWELKMLGTEGQVQAKHNWWGNQDRKDIRVIGSVEVKPVLKKPIDFKIFEEVSF